MNMLRNHDLTRLAARGFHLREDVVRGELDGISANLWLDASLRVQIFQGCQGVYELQGQGRGRPGKYVMVDQEWFTPSWSISKREKDEWVDLARGIAETVDTAVNDALGRFSELFPTIALPASMVSSCRKLIRIAEN
ncbi:hypothetical protein [Paraburkholderia tropica]|uniref:hypothetical protein n=1 Tax=Paraburkholderia tropica TaxID=92647 RepID=UPI002AB7EDB7|nr:hypothetical protein [Paraburkholderia tropica]